MSERNSNSPHILSTSANLAGLCFIVLTSRSLLGMKSITSIDEMAAFAIFSFMISCAFSFFSLKNDNKKGEVYERVADILFFIGLFSLFITTVLITLNIIN